MGHVVEVDSENLVWGDWLGGAEEHSSLFFSTIQIRVQQCTHHSPQLRQRSHSTGPDDTTTTTACTAPHRRQKTTPPAMCIHTTTTTQRRQTGAADGPTFASQQSSVISSTVTTTTTTTTTTMTKRNETQQYQNNCTFCTKTTFLMYAMVFEGTVLVLVHRY